MAAEDPTYQSLIEAGAAGDATVELKLTVRQVACLQMVVAMAVDFGLSHEAFRQAGVAGGDELAARFRVAFGQCQARIGIALAKPLGYDAEGLDSLHAWLAAFDGEEAGL